MHIIVDGYNFIRQVNKLSQVEKRSLEAGREALIRLLMQYKKIKRHKITVVFDGVLNLSEFAPSFQQSGIHIRFSPEGRLADDVIRDLVDKEREKAMVVSSDQSVLNHAFKQGSSVIRSPEFYDKVQMAFLFEGTDERDLSVQDSGRYEHKRWETKKKGPAKRLPKKERRNAGRRGKL